MSFHHPTIVPLCWPSSWLITRQSLVPVKHCRSWRRDAVRGNVGGLYSTFFDYILPGFEDTDHSAHPALTTFCGGLSCCWKERRCPSFANAVSHGAGKTCRGAQVLTWLGGVSSGSPIPPTPCWWPHLPQLYR